MIPASKPHEQSTTKFCVSTKVSHVVLLHVCILADTLNLIHLLQDYTGIDLSWHQRHLQMTPLFAATQASVAGGTLMEQSLGSDVASGALRATQQALAFTPIQG